MEKRKNFIIQHFKFLSGETSDEIFSSLRDAIYTEEKGLGTINVSIDEDLIQATLIKRVSTYVLDFNETTSAFDRKQIYVFSEVTFCIDFKNQLMVVFGPNSGVPLIRSFLRGMFYNSYELRQIEFTPIDFYEALKKGASIINISEASIDRFNYKNGVAGKFTARVIDQNIAEVIFTEHRSDINKALFVVDNGLGEFQLQVCSNGSFAVIGEDGEFENHFSLIKNLLNKIYA